MADELEGRVEEIEKSVENIESQLRAQTARTQSGSRLVLVIGIILVIVSIIYFAWLSSQIKTLAEPAELADSVMAITQAQGKVEEFTGLIEDYLTEMAPELVTRLREEALPQVPTLMQWLEARLTSQAPEHVAFLLDEMLLNMPLLRERSEALALEGVDAIADELDATIDDVVGQVLAMNKTEMQPLIEAAGAKEASAELELAFRQSLEQLIGPKLDEALRKYQGSMLLLEVRLNRLLGPEAQLSPEEKFEREVITALLVFIDDAIKEQDTTLPR